MVFIGFDRSRGWDGAKDWYTGRMVRQVVAPLYIVTPIMGTLAIGVQNRYSWRHHYCLRSTAPAANT
jgi:hypothetical protein